MVSEVLSEPWVMASYQIPAIETFDFITPSEWPNWIRRFERFRHASGVSGKSEESQVNTLIYSMGDKAKQKFDSHFVKWRIVWTCEIQ